MDAPDTEARLHAYINGMEQVQGWLSPTTAYAMASLLTWQSGRGETGGIAEIGIHHGKSFLPLAIAAEPADRLVAIDCFDDQQANLDKSGEGDLATFRQHLDTWVPGANVEIVARDSAQVRYDLAAHRMADLRFFSVDGGHTKGLTRNDLEIADRALRLHGICVLDDFLNPWWIGVVSGFFDFCRHNHGLQPVALLPNKLVLARPQRVDACRAFLRETLGPLMLKPDLELADGLVDFYNEFDPDQAPWKL